MSATYEIVHKSFIRKGSVDMVSMEDIKPNGRNYIMYLRLIEKEVEGEKIPRVPVGLIPFDTLSAYNTFIVNGVTIDPETREHIRPSFLKRIKLYKETVEEFGEAFQPNNEELDQLFQRYIADQESLSKHDLLYLRSFLHLDNTTVIHEVPVVGLEIRTEIDKILLQRGVGSWTFRRTSHTSTDSVLIKSLSWSVMNEETNKVECIHAIMCHVVGFGYYSASIPRNSKMAVIGGDTSIPKYTEANIYPCFIDLLDVFRKQHNLRGENYIQV